MVFGVGETFLSGALEAWIADEVGEGNAGPVLLRGSQVGQAAGLAGIVISAGLASIRLNLPLLAAGGLLLALGLFLALTMPETRFRPTPRAGYSPLQVMTAIWREGVQAVRGRPLLVMMLLTGVAAGAASEGIDRLWEAHFLTSFNFPAVGQLPPVVWFGIIGVTVSLLSIAGVSAVRTRVDTRSSRAVTRMLTVLTAVRLACIVAFALAGNFGWALGSYIALSVSSAIIQPLFQTWLNQQINSRVRATVLSFMGQMGAVGETVGGPVVGAVANRYSIRASLVLSAALLSPVLAAYARAKGRSSCAR